ncbi:MAG: helix-turn-helix transcriptional regulator [Clostridia bacterium]|nr:helix-turn-helix transcriptional regulator [Clostridia bacterium]MBR2078744.1 helix-turn-helix transcriptional regulator [Clostridia bacterium]MBR2417971.1 helix-turn-helix transcriptional regulator [Clostridia bacterium]
MLSESLKKVRKEHKLTQQDIAEVLGIDRSTYTFYETGKTSPSVATLHKLADIYNVTIGYLAGYEENHPELKTKHMTPSLSAPNIDPIAFLPKEEQIMLMCFRLLQDDKKLEIMKHIKSLSVQEEE